MSKFMLTSSGSLVAGGHNVAELSALHSEGPLSFELSPAALLTPRRYRQSIYDDAAVLQDSTGPCDLSPCSRVLTPHSY